MRTKVAMRILLEKVTGRSYRIVKKAASQRTELLMIS